MLNIFLIEEGVSVFISNSVSKFYIMINFNSYINGLDLLELKAYFVNRGQLTQYAKGDYFVKEDEESRYVAYVECGYFNLLRYDPRLEAAGKNPLQIDSKAPDYSKFKDFLLSENRFAQLLKVNPTHAEELMEKCENDAKKRRTRIEALAKD